MAGCTIALAMMHVGCTDNTLDESRVVTVYSARAEHLIQPIFERFTQETGIEVKYITASEAALIVRLKAEGERTPADLLLTVDAGNLWYAESESIAAGSIGRATAKCTSKI